MIRRILSHRIGDIPVGVWAVVGVGLTLFVSDAQKTLEANRVDQGSCLEIVESSNNPLIIGDSAMDFLAPSFGGQMFMSAISSPTRTCVRWEFPGGRP